MPVTFTSEAAKRIAKVVRRVEAMPQDRGGGRNPTGPTESEIWGWITGCDLSGQRYSFVRVVPDPSSDSPDLILDNAMKYRLFSEDPAHVHVAQEVNGSRYVPMGTIVRLSFVGYNADGAPAFIFQHAQPQAPANNLPIHDHRDNFSGGFAYAVYHPGTSLPQQKWAI